MKQFFRHRKKLTILPIALSLVAATALPSRADIVADVLKTTKEVNQIISSVQKTVKKLTRALESPDEIADLFKDALEDRDFGLFDPTIFSEGSIEVAIGEDGPTYNGSLYETMLNSEAIESSLEENIFGEEAQERLQNRQLALENAGTESVAIGAGSQQRTTSQAVLKDLATQIGNVSATNSIIGQTLNEQVNTQGEISNTLRQMNNSDQGYYEDQAIGAIKLRTNLAELYYGLGLGTAQLNEGED